MEQDWALNSISPTPCRAVGCLFSPNTPPKPPKRAPGAAQPPQLRALPYPRPFPSAPGASPGRPARPSLAPHRLDEPRGDLLGASPMPQGCRQRGELRLLPPRNPLLRRGGGSTAGGGGGRAQPFYHMMAPSCGEAPADEAVPPPSRPASPAPSTEGRVGSPPRPLRDPSGLRRLALGEQRALLRKPAPRPLRGWRGTAALRVGLA